MGVYAFTLFTKYTTITCVACFHFIINHFLLMNHKNNKKNKNNNMNNKNKAYYYCSFIFKIVYEKAIA